MMDILLATYSNNSQPAQQQSQAKLIEQMERNSGRAMHQSRE
jgi:hypothetical protein